MSHVRRLFELQAGKCFYCQGEMTSESYAKGTSPRGWTRDHFIPVVLGGQTNHNIVLAHLKCNTRKGDALPMQDDVERFLQLHGEKLRSLISARLLKGQQGVAKRRSEARRLKEEALDLRQRHSLWGYS